MTRPLDVDVPALQSSARELAALSDALDRAGVFHESQPAIDQPTGPATVSLTASAHHVVGECAANLLVFADDIAAAARAYEQTDAARAAGPAETMQPPR